MSSSMNLSQLKKKMVAKIPFTIVNHTRPECIGERRFANKCQTNGAYTKVKGEPNHKNSIANNGLGSWVEYGKASEWSFEQDSCGVWHCIFKPYGQFLWEIVFDIE